MGRFYRVKIGFTNCFLVLSGRKYVLVDTGVPGTASVLFEFLEEKGISPGEIGLIVLTHAHFDHAGNAFEVKSRTGSALLVHREEAEDLMRGKTDIPPALGIWGRFVSKFVAHLGTDFSPVEPDIIVESDFDLRELGFSGKILHTPGHTRGSITLLLEGGEAFVGDLLMSGPPLRLSPGLPVFAENRERVIESLRKLRSEGARMLYPSHGKPFPLSSVEHLLGGR